MITTKKITSNNKIIVCPYLGTNGNLNPAKITDNRTFWRTFKPYLSNNAIANEKIVLLENQEFLQMIVLLQQF